MVEALQSAADFLIVELTTMHLEKTTCCLQCLTDAGETSAEDFLREWGRGQAMRMGGILTGLMEFALQILQGDCRVAESHTDIVMPEQLHESRKANSEPIHFSRKSVSQPVRVHMSSATGTLGGLI